ncbi:MAG: helix-turn-helix transcriptional regulator [Lachnospiraceae bacterium]|nr:helix-turn-helix transcriptional regulator [Lachnospiraceae bacterium]
MENYEEQIGSNIRQTRQRLRWSQEKLAAQCGIANTTLSAYENSKKIPNLTTVAKIARSMGVSIESLYYGESASMSSGFEADEGKRVVNSVYALWNMGVISYYESYTAGVMIHYDQKDAVGTMLVLNRFKTQIRRLIGLLDEYKIRKNTYPDPEKYLEMVLASVAAEINEEILREAR